MFCFSEHFGTFATLTYSKLITRVTALRKGKRFGWLPNERVFGKHFQRHKQGLISVFTVEGGLKIKGKLANPHLHYLIEKYSKVTPDSVKEVWAAVSGRKAANLGVDLETIRSTDKVIAYIFKYITWENSPEVYIPKPSLKTVEKQ